MYNHNKIKIACLLLLITCTAPVAWGQIVYGQPPVGKVQFIYTHWESEAFGVEASINQISMPVSALIPVKDNLEFRFFTAGVSNSLDIGNSDYSLNGLSDTRVQVNQSFSDDQILLSVGVNLPTGKRELNLEEYGVMTVLTQNFLTFPMRRLGEGFGLNLLLGGATEMNDIRLGASAAFLYAGTYTAYEGGGDYNPGDWITLSADIQGGEDEFTWIGGLSYANASVDKMDDREIYDQGQSFSIAFGGRYLMDNKTINAATRYLIRGRNTSYDDEEDIVYQLKYYGNEFYIGGDMSWTFDKIWYAGPLLDLRFIGGNEFDLGASHLIGFGLQGGRDIGSGLNLGALFKYFTGSANDGDFDISGYQINVSLSGTF